MTQLSTDVRAASRALRRTPVSTIAGILALAVGIAGTTTMLGVVDAIDFRPLPFARPEQLLSLKEIAPAGSQFCHPIRGCVSSWTSRVTIDDWREARSIADIAGYRLYEETRWIQDGATSESIQAIEVTGNFFSLLGVGPYLGRVFDADELVPGGPPAVVLTYDFWRARFGGDRRVIGTVITLADMNRRTEGRFTVVGVMPERFRFLREQAFLPMMPGFPGRPDTREGRRDLAIGRLAPGATLAQARIELRTIAARVAKAYPETNRGWSATAETLDGRELLRVSESVVADVGRGRFLLLGVVALVLLLAVLNVGTLLLARGLARVQELAVRAAVGATRARIVQHLLVESACIAAAGGVVGVVLAFWSAQMARSWLSLDTLGIPITIDFRMLGVALATTGVAALAAGSIAVLSIRRLDLSALLQRRDAGGATPRSYIRLTLLSLELACALVLIAGGGLLTKELRLLRDREPGFDPHGLYRLEISLPASALGDTTQARAIATSAIRSIRAIPGVSAAALSLPSFGRVRIPGQDSIPGNGQFVSPAIEPSYFQTAGIRIVQGRSFGAEDVAGAESVAIVDEEAVRRYWNGASPVGLQVEITDGGGRRLARVVGVAARSKLWVASLTREQRAYVYVPVEQAWHEKRRGLFMHARISAANPQATLAAIREALRRASGGPVDQADVVSLEQSIGDELRRQRQDARAMSLFSALALSLAALGIWAVVAQGVAQRRHEIGVRIALGAAPRHIVSVVTRDTVLAALIGTGVGSLGALSLSRLLASTLVRVNPHDPSIYVGSVGLLVVVTVLAALLPSVRATRIAPMETLRE